MDAGENRNHRRGTGMEINEDPFLYESPLAALRECGRLSRPRGRTGVPQDRRHAVSVGNSISYLAGDVAKLPGFVRNRGLTIPGEE